MAGLSDRLGLIEGAEPGRDGEVGFTNLRMTFPDDASSGSEDAAGDTELAQGYRLVGPEHPLEVLEGLRAAGYRLLLSLGGPDRSQALERVASVPGPDRALFDAAAWGYAATGDDPMEMDAALLPVLEALGRPPKPLPLWLLALGVPIDAETPARVVKFAAHGLALGLAWICFVPPQHPDAREPALRAYDLLRHQLDGAQRIAMTARGQYRIEIPGRPNRYLMWAGEGIRRLPSSLQGPLHVTDLGGSTLRIETTRLKLSAAPVFVDRE